MYVRLQLDPTTNDEFFAGLEIPESGDTKPASLSERLLEHAKMFYTPAFDRLDELTGWHGLDPRLTPELALIVLAEAARMDTRPHP
jgi:hypothetical protein